MRWRAKKQVSRHWQAWPHQQIVRPSFVKMAICFLSLKAGCLYCRDHENEKQLIHLPLNFKSGAGMTKYSCATPSSVKALPLVKYGVKCCGRAMTGRFFMAHHCIIDVLTLSCLSTKGWRMLTSKWLLQFFWMMIAFARLSAQSRRASYTPSDRGQFGTGQG